ncbi:ANTAR domain-containing protein [Streptomyces sp. SID14478]|uniref:ANTAR domain-containing protein n=1 Tax=Streptomyces sp. SID14478 TaxID=2706073 RepID=UPI001EF3C722|nr:ANTAR domain-containing protein [Streptomyces sp. SID14478]
MEGHDPVNSPPVEAWLPALRDLARQVGQLTNALTLHEIVDQAIGVVIALGALNPDEGFPVLRTVSQNLNIELRTVAEQLVRWPGSGILQPDIRQALETALEHARAQHAAAAGGTVPAGFVRDVVERVTPSVLRARAAGRDQADEILAEHIEHTVDLLLERSHVLAERVAAGRLGVVGLSYRLADGSAQLLASRGLDAELSAAS